ncbi:hypothetical protein CYMTET_33432 [Cymbomonas tetramitiformis]|uniref:Uncharacterized protein n=1 Tax=Cymbomonas tetramitiformis TaxID=36881 RepID=A0AAE0FD50_9CHLO|nr:hypothetical protein CYMTET_33432 [Cymbomonas tetramitiformis]
MSGCLIPQQWAPCLVPAPVPALLSLQQECEECKECKRQIASQQETIENLNEELEQEKKRDADRKQIAASEHAAKVSELQEALLSLSIENTELKHAANASDPVLDGLKAEELPEGLKAEEPGQPDCPNCKKLRLMLMDCMLHTRPGKTRLQGSGSPRRSAIGQLLSRSRTSMVKISGPSAADDERTRSMRDQSPVKKVHPVSAQHLRTREDAFRAEFAGLDGSVEVASSGAPSPEITIAREGRAGGEHDGRWSKRGPRRMTLSTSKANSIIDEEQLMLLGQKRYDELRQMAYENPPYENPLRMANTQSDGAPESKVRAHPHSSKRDRLSLQSPHLT